jgi:hypothetical protein
MRTIKEILNDLRTKPSANVPDTGKILAGKSANASYEAARNKTLGVDTFWVGGQLRTASIDVLRKLGLEHEAKFTEAGQHADAPALPSAALEPAPARPRKATPVREAATPRVKRAVPAAKPNKSKHQEAAEIA